MNSVKEFSCEDSKKYDLTFMVVLRCGHKLPNLGERRKKKVTKMSLSIIINPILFILMYNLSANMPIVQMVTCDQSL